MAIRAYINALFSYLGIGQLENKIIYDKKIKKGKTLKTQVERAFAGCATTIHSNTTTTGSNNVTIGDSYFTKKWK